MDPMKWFLDHVVSVCWNKYDSVHKLYPAERNGIQSGCEAILLALVYSVKHKHQFHLFNPLSNEYQGQMEPLEAIWL